MKNARDNSATTGGGEEDTSRPTKRPRIAAGDAKNGAEKEKQEYLPPEVWAGAANFLPYEDVLNMAAVSRSMLKDVMPGIKVLHITKAEQLHVGLTSRYRDVVDLSLFCMLHKVNVVTADQDMEPTLCTNGNACGRITPFICRFPRLERVFLGGLRSDDDEPSRNPIQSFIDIPFDWLAEESDAGASRRDGEIARGVIRSLSGAYRCGALSSKVWVAGPSCPRSERTFFSFALGDTCETCIDACKSFPIASVLDFENRGSSQTLRESDVGGDFSICGVDVCLTRRAIEDIIAKRPGGKELLYSKERLFQLLGRGERNVIAPDEGKEMYVVKYETRAIRQICEVIEKGKIDVTKLESAEVVEAIMRSFAMDERDPVPPKGQCHLTESAFIELRDIGFPISEDDFLNETNADNDPFSPTKKKVFRFY